MSPQKSKHRTGETDLRAWKPIASILIALAITLGVFQPISAMPMHPLENNIAVPEERKNDNVNDDDLPPFPYFEPDTEVFVYTGNGDTGWQPIPFAMVPWEVEFLFEDRLYHVDADGWVRVNQYVDANAETLAETDRPFEPYNWRWPESEDVVRFVDRDNRHLRHDRMGTFQAGDRFWFQGILYEAFADPDNPPRLAFRATEFVLDADIGMCAVEEFAAARGDSLDSLDEVRRSSVDSSPVDVSTGELNELVERNVGLTGFADSSSSYSGANAASGVGGLPTDFGFAGQRYDSSTGLIHMGARYYDPLIGRFVSPDTMIPDPYNPQDLNRYSYARNNPLRYIDPTGHQCVGPYCPPYPIPWQDVARAGGALAVSAPEIAVPAVIGVGSTVAVGGLLYYGSCWAMQDMGPAYQLPTYASGQIAMTHPMAGSTTLTINTGMAGETATPSGPNDPFRSYKNEAEQYQHRTSRTRFGDEPYLDVEIEGQTHTLRPDNIADGYISESKWMDPQSQFYWKQFGTETGLDWQVQGWAQQVERYSLAAQQHGYHGVKIFVNIEEAALKAAEMYGRLFPNVEFIFVP